MLLKPRFKIVAYTAAVLACAGVFMLYMQPEFMVTLADQLWSCF